MKKGTITELMISDRDSDENVYTSHSEVIGSIRDVCQPEYKGISLAALEAFQVYEGTVPDFLAEVGVQLQAAVRENRAFDFGVVKNRDVIRWADDAKENPVEDLFEEGKPIVFMATHPEEVPYADSASVYLVSPGYGDTARLTEFTYIKESQKFLIFASMTAQLPLGSNPEVTVTAWSENPTTGLVDSTLNPCLMGAAFLRTKTEGKVS